MSMSPEIPVSFTVVMVFVFLVVGFFVGRAVTFFTMRKKNADATPQPVSPVEQPAPLADPEKYTELVRLWREKKGSGLFVETSGHLLASSAPLNPAQKKRFIELIKELANWLSIDIEDLVPKRPEIVTNPEDKSTVKVEPVATQVKAATPVNTDPIPTAPPVVAVPPPTAAAIPVQPKVPPAVITPVSPIQPPSAPAADKPKKQATSMVEQVDEILQELILQSDQPNRHIKLMEEMNEGVIVWVGQERFSGIDTVTDESAISLIRSAAKEWERRTEIRPTGA